MLLPNINLLNCILLRNVYNQSVNNKGNSILYTYRNKQVYNQSLFIIYSDIHVHRITIKRREREELGLCNRLISNTYLADARHTLRWTNINTCTAFGSLYLSLFNLCPRSALVHFSYYINCYLTLFAPQYSLWIILLPTTIHFYHSGTLIKM